MTKRDDVPIISGFQSKERWENSLYTNSTDDLEELLANLKNEIMGNNVSPNKLAWFFGGNHQEDEIILYSSIKQLFNCL